MQTNKSTKIIFWISTGLLALFILPGIFFIAQKFALDGSAHLGIPVWLHYEVGIGKFIGALILLLPFFPKRIKEWAYVAFGIDFISATIGQIATDGPSGQAFFPVLIFAILLVSYITFHKLHPSDHQGR